MCSIPNLRICAPADSLELEAQLRQAIVDNQPTYLRIGKKGEPDLLWRMNHWVSGKQIY